MLKLKPRNKVSAWKFVISAYGIQMGERVPHFIVNWSRVNTLIALVGYSERVHIVYRKISH